MDDNIDELGVPRTRCPECETALLNTITILIRRKKRTRQKLPLKACHHCKVLIANKKKMNDWRIWDGVDYLDLI